jgi:cytidylate kinase
VTALLPELTIEMKHDDAGMQRMLLNGEDVTDEIRTPDVSIYASDVSAMAAVRAFLMNMQREMADKYNVVMDGRDIGTVVLPNASLKFFLTADPEVRAMRRYRELLEKNAETTYEDVLRDMGYRDKNDSSRKTAPLSAAEDAVVVDTTGYSLEDSFQLLYSVVEEKLNP